jgi:hypothetical protein
LDPKTVAALAEKLSPHVDLSKSRCETLSFLTLAMISARTSNLSILAGERVAAAQPDSTYRRLQRLFQHADLEADWAAPIVTALAGITGPRKLVLDRTNWKTGRSEINLLVLAVVTREHRLPLMWTVLDRAGNSGAAERIDLIERYIALFGKESIKLLLGDREFIGADWLTYLIGRDIPFVIRMRGGQHAVTAEGRQGSLESLLAGPGGRRRQTVTLSNMAGQDGTPGPRFAASALRPKAAEPVIVLSNRPGLNALDAYRKRWAIECLFADAKSRGLNFEDTRLRAPRKLALLTAILALAMAWASRAAADLLGRRAPPRKSHGYFAKSRFRIGLERLRTLLRSDSARCLETWRTPQTHPKTGGVV